MRALIAAAAVLLTPAAAPVAQDNEEFILPDLDSDLLLMAELVETEVTFVRPSGIAKTSDLRIAAIDAQLASLEPVTVSPTADAGGAKHAAVVSPGAETAASLTFAAPPGMPVTILVDDVVAGDGYSLVDFRCNYAGSDTACDGQGFSATTVASGTLIVGATLTGDENLMAGTAGGRFDVTISYQ